MTSERKIKKIIELYRTADHSIQAICDAVGISKPTFYNLKRLLPWFADALAATESERLENIKDVAQSSLMKLLNGYDFKEVTKEYKREKKDNGKWTKPMVVAQRITTKSYAPNAAAVIFALKSTDPDHFFDVVHNRVTGEGGKPIQIDTITKIDYSLLTDNIIEALLNARRKPGTDSGSGDQPITAPVRELEY